MSTLATFETNATNDKFASYALRDYQIDAVNKTVDAFNTDKLARVLITQPTGSGKTLTVAAVLNDQRIIDTLKRDATRPFRVVFRCHMKRLATQAKRLFEQEPRFVSVEKFGEHSDPSLIEVVYVSLSKKITDEFDLMVIDEAHHEACSGSQSAYTTMGFYPMVGITATPERSDKLLIKFNHVISGLTRRDAVQRQFICDADINTIVDTSGKLDKVPLMREIVDNFVGEMRQTIVFMRTLDECVQVADYLCQKGYQAVAVTGDYEGACLDKLLDDFSDGAVQFLVSSRKLGEGIDCANVSDVIIAKRVGSYTDLNQHIGRASRPDNSDCRVWELIDPLSGNNLDSTQVVGRPKSHRLIYKRAGEWHTIQKTLPQVA